MKKIKVFKESQEKSTIGFENSVNKFLEDISNSCDDKDIKIHIDSHYHNIGSYLSCVVEYNIDD